MLDAKNCFTIQSDGSLAEALTVSAQLENYLDLIGADTPTTIRLGEGKKSMILKIMVTIAFTDMDEGGSFVVYTDDTTNVSAGRVVADTGILSAAELAAGVILQIPLVGVFERYLGVDFVAASTAATLGSIIAWLDDAPEPNITSPDMDDAN